MVNLYHSRLGLGEIIMYKNLILYTGTAKKRHTIIFSENFVTGFSSTVEHNRKLTLPPQ